MDNESWLLFKMSLLYTGHISSFDGFVLNDKNITNIKSMYELLVQNSVKWKNQESFLTKQGIDKQEIKRKTRTIAIVCFTVYFRTNGLRFFGGIRISLLGLL